jgi:hypothetical protein
LSEVYVDAIAFAGRLSGRTCYEYVLSRGHSQKTKGASFVIYLEWSTTGTQVGAVCFREKNFDGKPIGSDRAPLFIDCNTFDGAASGQSHDVVLAGLDERALGRRVFRMMCNDGTTRRFHGQFEVTFGVRRRGEVR